VSPLVARAGKVLVDWRQNDPNRSLIAAWSLRAATTPVVAAPVPWAAVEDAAARRDASGLRLTPADALRALREGGDPLEGGRFRGGCLPGR
jgi:bifunctional non-homologous end joining protein LigD